MAHHPHIPPRVYFLIYGALIVLTLTTVLIASNLRLGVWEIPVALGIATVKTVLVALYFMHLLQASRLMQVVAVTGVAFLGLLLAITMADYGTRGWHPETSPPAQLDQR